MSNNYNIKSIYNFHKSKEIYIGHTPLGGNNPIRIQSMTNTNTLNTEATVEQIVRLSDIGCEYVRIAVPGTKEASNLYAIKNELHKKNYNIPLIADVHYIPQAAEIAAEIVEKVRINPGNYIDKNVGKIHFTGQEYAEELDKIANRIEQLIEICKKNNTVIRIGTNHGSLSERILSRFGDTPKGMAVSAMEFIKICNSFDFHLLVLSMKASNIRVMTQSTRMLVAMMEEENMNYPIHLGVTEAGNEEDGRIKSAGGIGALLSDGIGDTIRVSLTEDPEKEIPVAKKIVSYYNRTQKSQNKLYFQNQLINPFEYTKRETIAIENIGGKNPPIIISSERNENADYFCTNNQFVSNNKDEIFPLFNDISELNTPNISKKLNFLKINEEFNLNNVREIKSIHHPLVLISHFKEQNIINERELFYHLLKEQIKLPVIIAKEYTSYDDFILKGSADYCGLLVDGFGDGIYCDKNAEVALNILQAIGSRITKTEFISCPSCGRTRYDIQASLAEIKKRMSHLKGLKIGVMGCIVNGPGEMADANYGYVGSGEGKITLYKGKNVVQRNIDENKAIDALINLIKENGDWIDG